MVIKHYIAICIPFLIIALYWKDAPKVIQEPTVASSTPVVVQKVAQEATKIDVYNETVRVAIKYHLDQERFSKTIMCESGYNPKALNSSDPYGGSRGVGQFLQPTFDHYKVLAGLPDGDLWNYKDAIEVMGYMWSIKQQKQWSIYRILYGDMQYMEKMKNDCNLKYKKFVDNL